MTQELRPNTQWVTADEVNVSADDHKLTLTQEQFSLPNISDRKIDQSTENSVYKDEVKLIDDDSIQMFESVDYACESLPSSA